MANTFSFEIACAYVYTCIYVYIYMYIHVRVWAYARAYVRTYTLNFQAASRVRPLVLACVCILLRGFACVSGLLHVRECRKGRVLHTKRI